MHAVDTPAHPLRNHRKRHAFHVTQDKDLAVISRQLAEALHPDVRIGHRQTRRYLALLKAGYRRTAQTVRHKQDPQKVERAVRVLDGLKKKRGRAA